MSKEHALNLDQRKKFGENYRPVKVCLWFSFEITEAHCCLLLFRRASFNLKDGFLLLSTKCIF